MGLCPAVARESCCDLLEYQNPSVYRTASTAPSTPGRPRGRHRGWLWSASKTSRWAGGPAGSQPRGWGWRVPPPKRTPYRAASLDDRAGERPPPRPLKERKKGARAAPQLPSPLSPSPQRSERRRGPNGPQASDRSLLPSLFCHGSLRTGTSQPPPLPPTPARAPAGSPQRSPRGRLIRGASA